MPRGDNLQLEVIAVFGPTASGKTAVAEALADRLGTEVVSADALQVYRELPILTNQPQRPTRLVAIRSVTETMSVGEYAPLAHAALDELVATSGVAVLAGGTGLYVRAALADLRVPPAPLPGLRAQVEREYDTSPVDAHARLARLDAAAADAVHVNDRRRVVRALELAEGGTSLVPVHGRLWSDQYRRPTLMVGIDLPTEILEQRIRARTEAMFASGVTGEVRLAMAHDVSRTAAKALGLNEIASLAGRDALERIVVRTRQYAVYQRKWLRRLPLDLLLDGQVAASDNARLVLKRYRGRADISS